MTYAEVFRYFHNYYRETGLGDKAAAQAASPQLFKYFDFYPDVLWIIPAGEFSADFAPAYSSYEFLNYTSATGRTKLYRYMARVHDIYEASIAR